MITRPYDKFLPSAALPLVRRRRDNPTGFIRDVGKKKHGNTEVYDFPWDRMELGDFFVVKTEGRKKVLLTSFRQVAKRRDWELVVRDWKVDGEPGLRVTLTLMDVSIYKQALQKSLLQSES